MAAPLGQQSKSRGWLVLYAVTGTIDLVQFIIAWTGVGIIVGEILEVVTPFLMLGILKKMGIPLLAHPARLISILGLTAVADALTLGMAPFWVVDVWLLKKAIKKDDAAHNAQHEQENSLENQAVRAYYKDGVRQPSKSSEAPPRINDGVRAPQGRVSRPPKLTV
jgi:hypothetical protein